MLKNYIKIALAVLGRRKFFTFISLFGISLTLTVLMVATAFLDNILSPGYPDIHRDRVLYASSFYLVDQKGGNINGGSLGHYFITHYLSTLKIPEAIGFISHAARTNTYINDKKLNIDLCYTNDRYWDIMQYDFLEGKPFGKREIDNREQVAVIAEDTKNDYFGRETPALGKFIEADNIRYRVIGVVRNESATDFFTAADMYLPYTLSKAGLDSKDLVGDYVAFLMAPTKADVPAMGKEFDNLFSKIPLVKIEYDHQYSWADPYLATFTRGIARGPASKNGFQDGPGTYYFYLISALLALLLMLLPTINLININITRIMERSSEIGVRKAFGASSNTLVIQFVVENIFLTLLGGIIGVLLSMGALALINHAQPIPNIHLTMNLTVLSIGLLLCLFFGLLSGVYPAWRMSRLNVVTALKA